MYREVDYLRFDDHALKWRVFVLPGQTTTTANLAVETNGDEPLPDTHIASSTSTSTPTTTTSTPSRRALRSQQQESAQGGCYLFATYPDRRVCWRYVAAGGVPTLELVELSFSVTLTQNALRVKLPKEEAVCGVHLCERQSRLFLCVATVVGAVYVCEFEGHPGTSPTQSIFSPEFSPAAKVVAAERLERLGEAEVSCCSWLVDEGVSVAFGLSSGSVKLMTIGLSSEALRGEEVTLEDSTLAQRLWSGMGMGMGMLNRKAQAEERGESAGVVAMAIVKKQMLFLVALYADCKLRVWSVGSESCTATLPIPLPKSHSRTKAKAVTVRKGWLRRVPAGLLVVVSCASSASFGLLFSGSLKASSFSLSSSPQPVALYSSEEEVRGTRLQAVEVTEDGSALSLWWSLSQPRKKLLFLHDLNFNAAKENAKEKPRQLLMQEGMDASPYTADDAFSAALQAFQSRASGCSLDMQAAVEDYYVARLQLPGRFSCLDVAEGIASCFGQDGAATMDRYLRDKSSRLEWPVLVDVAKDLVRTQVRSELQESGFEGVESRCEVLGGAWERLLQDCEQAWSLKQMPTGLFFSLAQPSHRGLVRMNTLSALRATSDVEVRQPLGVLGLAKRMARESKEQGMDALWRSFVHDKGPTGFRRELDRAALVLSSQALGELKELAVNASVMHEQVQQVLEQVRAGDGLESLTEGEVAERSTSLALAKILHETVRQKAQARLEVSLGLALIISCLSKGVASSSVLLREYWSSLHDQDIQVRQSNLVESLVG